MMGATEFVGRVAVVEQAGISVRVLLHGGETLYSARDILTSCGVKYPAKWCQREAQSQSSVKLEKLMYPVNGKNGGASRQSCPMYFTNEECGRMITEMVGCDKSVREWLEKEVFNFKISPKGSQAPSERAEADPEQKAPGFPASAGDDYLEKTIDNLIFTLLDLKKHIAQPHT